MQAKTMRKLSMTEAATMLVLADRIEKEIDPTLADLYRRVAQGDDSALVPAVDRLKELGRDEQAEQLKAAVLVATFEPGQKVFWWMESRRGYCPAWWVPATVVKVGPKRVTIDAELARGGTKRVVVKTERLKVREAK